MIRFGSKTTEDLFRERAGPLLTRGDNVLAVVSTKVEKPYIDSTGVLMIPDSDHRLIRVFIDEMFRICRGIECGSMEVSEISMELIDFLKREGISSGDKKETSEKAGETGTDKEG